MGLNLYLKDANWVIGWKRKKNQDPIVVCKKHTSVSKTHTGWKWKGRNTIYPANGIQKEAELAIPTSDKIELRLKLVKRDKKVTIY
jgi:hypothetical protein